MSVPLTEDQTIAQRDAAKEPMPTGVYINCVFRDCQFANANFINCRFTECRFEDCNLSNAEVSGTAFQEVSFHGCRLLGIAWEDCKPLLLQLRFEKCLLDYGLFGPLRMEGTVFLGCSVREADFTGTRLKEADFSRSDLTNARFEGAQLQNTDFRMAENFTIHPEHNDLKGALFTRQEAWRLLQGYGIRFE